MWAKRYHKSSFPFFFFFSCIFFYLTKMEAIHLKLKDETMESLLEEDIEQEAFDRISGLLSELIQEANEAVHKESPKSSILAKKSIKTRKLSRKHSRSTSSSSPSSSSLPSPTVSTSLSSKKLQIRRRSRTFSSVSPQINKRIKYTQDPLAKSFKRLDDSIALVNTLSRELIMTENKPKRDFSLFFSMSLLHIPHSLFTMVLDFCIPLLMPQKSSQVSSFQLTTMVFWACVFTMTNFVVDQVAITKPERWMPTKSKTAALPGSY